MDEIYEFLKTCRTFFLATEENGQPHVRPMGGVLLYEEKLYIVTNTQKKVSGQIRKNPRVELCALSRGRWLRLEATAIPENRTAVRQAMLDLYPDILGRIFTVDDKRLDILCLTGLSGAFYSFTSAPRPICS